MAPSLRNFLTGLFASALAVWIGISLAQEEYFVASLSAGVCVWVILAWTRGPLAEAWLVAFLFAGYVIGNRGFAQLTPVPGLPLFFSELGLGFAFSMVVLRSSLKRELPLRRDWLNGLLLLWLAIGLGRLFWDVKSFGFLAMRDFAMVYYLLYFFTAQSLAQHEPSRELLQKAVVVTLALLPVAGMFAYVFPDFFRTHFLVEGVPIIFFKGDLLATYLFTGFVVLLPNRAFNWRDGLWRWLAAVASLVLGFVLISRAGIVGLAVALGWLGLAGRWIYTRVVIAVCAIGLVLLLVTSLLQEADFKQTKAYEVYEAVTSIADYSGTRHYENAFSSDNGDNNRFRLTWWKTVANETFATSPVVGLGFGADLAHGFLLEYYPTSANDFNTRSPHNIFITTLGRMGLLGVGGLLAIYWTIGRTTAQNARNFRRGSIKPETLAMQAAIWIVMISACFGVVLEGPMGAMPFWIMLGLSHYDARTEMLRAENTDESAS